MNNAVSYGVQMGDAGNSVADRIAQALAERIISGELAPGCRLMQDHLADQFQASHVPVREAFRKLEAQGLVVSKPRCGVRVSEIDPGAVREVTEMRAALEGLALHLAFPCLTAADLDAAQKALIDGEASDRIADWEAANRRFHLAITAPCGMPRLMASIEDLHRSDARFLFATWKQLDWQPRSDTEHWAILEALQCKDAARARELLEAHVREAGSALEQSLRHAAVEAGAARSAELFEECGRQEERRRKP
jgi:DNA-binding GntR family transcriptional regulator